MKTVCLEKNDPKERGSALMMIVFTVFLIMLVVSAIFALSRQNFMSVNKDEHANKADYAAKAGIEHAIAMLADDSTIGSVVAHGDQGVTFTNIPLEGNPDLTYTLQLINNDLPVPPQPAPAPLVDAPDGLKIPGKVIWVKSTGAMRDRANASSSSLIKLVGYQRPLLKQSLFGIDFVEVIKSTVQGYDSRQHFPMGQVGFTNSPFTTFAKRADIGTNSTTYEKIGSVLKKGIEIANDATVHGQVRAGVGAPNFGDVVKVFGTQDHTEDPANPQVVSQEATQVPRFVLGTDSTKADYAFTQLLVAHNLTKIVPIPSDLPTPPWAYKPVPASTAIVPGEVELFPNTTTPGTTVVPDFDLPRTGYSDLRMVLPGYYDLANPVQNGSIVLDDVALRSGGRYHFKGDVTFSGRVNVAYHDPGLKKPIDPSKGPYPVVIYVDGDVTFAPGCKVNMDRVNEDNAANGALADPTFPGDTDSSEPLPPRRLQIYTSNDKSEDFRTDPKGIVLVGGTTARSEVSAVLVGSNMKANIINTDFYGGIQALGIKVNDSKINFDIALWGTPLEGRGQMAVLLNTVQVYTPISAPAPMPVPVASAPGPASSPTYNTYTTGPGYCSPIIPIPQYMQPCY